MRLPSLLVFEAPEPSFTDEDGGDGGDAGYAVRVVSGTLTWIAGNDTTHVKGEAQ